MRAASIPVAIAVVVHVLDAVVQAIARANRRTLLLLELYRADLVVVAHALVVATREMPHARASRKGLMHSKQRTATHISVGTLKSV